MSNLAIFARACLLSGVVLGGWFHALASAATFRLPLVGLNQPDVDEGILTVDYDFGTAFSHIDSVALEFVMPNGFDGGGGTTGNSSWWRTLNVVLQGTEEPIDFSSSTAWPSYSSTLEYLTGDLWRVYPQRPTKLGFLPPNLGIGIICSHGTCNEPFEPEWPDFVHSGRGSIAFFDFHQASYHPLPSGNTVSSSTSLGPAGKIESAYLTIVGTPVPEPNSLALLLIGLAFTTRSRTQIRSHIA